VFGTGTALDSARFRFYLAEKLKVDVHNVHGYVIGEHGDAQIPLWSATQIAGQSVDEYCESTGLVCKALEKEEIAAKTRTGGADVIKLKGATYFAIAGIIQNVVHAVIKDTNSIKTVCTCLNGQYGISDVSLSLPCIVNSRGADRVIQYDLAPEEEEALQACAIKMKEFMAQVKAD
jgi:L-lactate dehydrogenase